jgi:hypothetical protein
MTAPLWPQPIPILGVTGEFASGKTLFCLSVSPGPQTLVYDCEKSSESYAALGCDRVDVPAEMLRRHPSGYAPVRTFEWWRDHVRSVKPGRYRVIALDTAGEIESGLVDWVRANPQHFGRTSAQYVKMESLLWGDVREHWKGLLTDLASRCETFVFSTHLGRVWVDNKPTQKTKPRGKSTLMELASLYLQLERRPDPKGNVPATPSAVVLKTRLAHARIDTDGNPVIVPSLPPRLPQATPAAIRAYQLSPPDAGKLSKDERAPEQQLSDDDRAAVRLATAEAERDAEQLRLERLSRARPAREVAAPETPPVKRGPGRPAASDAEPPKAPPPADKATDEQVLALAKLRDLLCETNLPDGTQDERSALWRGVLSKRGVKSARDLTAGQADELATALASKLGIRNLGDWLDGGDDPTPGDDPEDD